MEFIKIIAEAMEYVFTLIDDIIFNDKNKTESKSNYKTNKKETDDIEKHSFVIQHKKPLVKIFVLNKLNDAELVAKEVLDGNVVVVQMKTLNEEETTRAKNFIYGFCYGYNLMPEMVDDNTLVIDPFHKNI